MLRLDPAECGAYRGGVRDIEREGAGVVAEFGGACLQSFGVAAVQQDARTGACQPLCDRPADATGTARDEGQATREIEVRGISYWVRAPSRSAASGAAWCSAAPPD
jgi:hypothetical protein